ncbi:MAG TPA: DUF742 domain-containing protein [Acidimicrobiales bacterium]
MPDDDWELEAGVVRPYLFTNGRTRPERELLAVEAMVTATDKGGAATAELTPEQRRVVELCATRTQSVAEIAAHLSMPLGVVRVLVADLADDHLVEVFEGATDLVADVKLLQRLIARVKAIPG